MKKLLFATLTAAILASCAGGTPAAAMEARVFVPLPKPQPATPAPRFVVMSDQPPIQLLPGSTIDRYVTSDPWSFLVQSRGENGRFEAVGRYVNRDACESERAEVAESADVSYVSATCSQTD